MVMSLHSFSQERFSKRKYRRGVFTEKQHRIKTHIVVSDQDVPEKTTVKQTDHEECPDVLITVCLPEGRATLKDTVACEMRVIPDTADAIPEHLICDAYSHIPKHNTTGIAPTPYASISGRLVNVKFGSRVIGVQENKNVSKRAKSAYYGKPFSLRESWFLYSLILGSFLLIALSEGIIVALILLAYGAALIFIVCLAFMGFLKLFSPNMKIF